MSTFKPLLAETAEDLSALRYPLLASPKLDGIRCVKLNGKALSRKLKPIPNTFVRTWVEANLPDGIDGELLLRDHRTPFNEVSSAIMSEDGEPDFVFAAFDFLQDPNHTSEPDDSSTWANRAHEQEFEVRLDALRHIAHRIRHAGSGIGGQQSPSIGPRLLVVEHVRVDNFDALNLITDRHLIQGYEGTMVRDPAGRYKFGRSTLKEGILLKIKPFVDEEATVVDVVEQMHNKNVATKDNLGHTKRSTAKAGKTPAGKLGALKCVTEDGASFEIGTGFTDAQRVEFWKLANTPSADCSDLSELHGRLVKFKHQPPPGGRKPGEAPRFPVFLGWRSDHD